MYTVHTAVYTAAISSEPDLNLKQAVYFVRVAWQNVSPVQNYWSHARFTNKDSLVSLVTNSQETNESVPAATLAQTSDEQPS